jgi:hypothetical protein
LTATPKNGYQLRVGGATTTSPWELKLIKWVNGTATTLGSTTVTVPTGAPGARLALVDKGRRHRLRQDLEDVRRIAQPGVERGRFHV